jgi:regulator of sigma E protease
VKYGVVTDSVGMAMGLRNGDKILTVDNQYIDNFFQLTTDIVLNDRKTIQVDRNGEMVNIDIPQSYVTQMLKGRGQIDPRLPFSPFVIGSFAKDSPAHQAGVRENDEACCRRQRSFRIFRPVSAISA